VDRVNTLTLATLIGLTALASGCLGTHQGHPEKRGGRSVQARGRTDNAPAMKWAKVYLEQGPKAPHLGYVRSEKVDGGYTHWIYDLKFNLVGKVTPHGQTFTMDSQGKEVNEGHFNVPNAMLKVFGYAKYHRVELRRMPTPRTS